MEFKFIVLALVISFTTGEDTLVQPTNGVSPSRDAVINRNTGPENNVYQTGGNNRSAHADLLEQNKTNAKPLEVDVSVLTDNTSNTNGIADNTTTAAAAATAAATAADAATTTTTTTTTSSTTTTSPIPANTESRKAKTEAPITTSPNSKPISFNDTWTVKNVNNSVCIAVKMELKFVANYPALGNSTKNVTVTIPKNATASGNCSSEWQIIILNWENVNLFNINFTRDKKDKFEINSFYLTLNASKFDGYDGSDKNVTYFKMKPDFPEIPLNMSYKCDKELNVKLVSAKNYTADLFMAHTHLEAFMSKKDSAFGEAKFCENFDTPDIVPIAVGCVLSILILLVLAAYLIGRRSQNRGYLSM